MVTITQKVVKPPAITTTPIITKDARVVQIEPRLGFVEAQGILALQSLPKTKVKSITPVYSDVEKTAMEQYTQTKMGTWLFSKSAFVQKYVPALRAATTVAQLKGAGYELAPSGTTEQLYGTTQEYNAFQTQARKQLITMEEQQYQRELEYRQREQQWQDVLYKSTAEGATAKAQLADVTSAYQQLLEDKPTEGFNWQTIALYGGLAIAGLAIIIAIIKRK